LGERHNRNAHSILATLASIPASSAVALDAKARLVPIVLDDDGDYGYISEEGKAFYRAFAADVRTFLKPIVYEHWAAKIESKRQKKAA
jgi:hypothetical protein